MNFCSFASCSVSRQPTSSLSSHVNEMHEAIVKAREEHVEDEEDIEVYKEEMLIAVPNTLTSETVDIFHLPSSTRKYQLSASPLFKGGMIMALSIFHHPNTEHLTVVAGFESGHTSVTVLDSGTWKTVYVAKAHPQPLLSLDISANKDFYYTSSADATICKHLIPSTPPTLSSTSFSTNSASSSFITSTPSLLSASFASATKSTPSSTPKKLLVTEPEKILNTKHAGQQSLRLRNDGRIFATAGWDGRVRVYDSAKMREVAVLKWVAGDGGGVYSIAFADVEIDVDEGKKVGGESQEVVVGNGLGEGSKEEKNLVKRMGGLSVREERARKAEKTHWIAVGGKDGKISLWDIY
jgi:WD40 repeat protein